MVINLFKKVKGYMSDKKTQGKVYGYLKVDGDLTLTGDLEVEHGISVTGSIYCAGYSIVAGDSIKAGGSIKAGDSIKAGGSIKAGYWIKAGSLIEARLGITAFLHITCKTTLNAGLRIIVGVCNWREIEDKDKTVTCGKLESGEVVGILKETGIEEEKPEEMVTIDGKKWSASTIKEALKQYANN